MPINTFTNENLFSYTLFSIMFYNTTRDVVLTLLETPLHQPQTSTTRKRYQFSQQRGQASKQASRPASRLKNLFRYKILQNVWLFENFLLFSTSTLSLTLLRAIIIHRIHLPIQAHAKNLKTRVGTASALCA